jgi:glutamate synthase domain-containing protein 2/CDGSH-type Zn-finger protein
MSTKEPTIEPSGNGPYLVKDLDNLTGPDGNPIDTKPKMALCRCGKTANRPFCDGTHVAENFSDAKLEGRVEDRRHNYKGRKITIHDNRGVCSHAGFCTDKLASVFRMRTEPWIDPDGADAEKIIEVVEMCPSGALSYTIDDVEHRDLEREPSVKISPNGPYLVEGGVELAGVDSPEGASSEHRTLCRCGESKNKPFCDGAHWYVGFRDDNRRRVAVFSELEDAAPTAAQVDGVDLVVVKNGDDVSVLQGLCLHQGALMADGYVEDGKLVCGLHGWSYDSSSGELTDMGDGGLRKFESWIENDEVLISLDELAEWKSKSSAGDKEQKGDSAGATVSAALGENREEPHNEYIRHLAEHGLTKTGAHGPMSAMGVPRYQLPTWDDIQFVTAQLHKVPQLDDVPVGTELVIGPRASKPLRLEIPLFVSDMSFGALSMEAKVSLARGAELAGTGICSGEGGMLPEEQAENSRYFYELASARFGFSFEQLARVQAFHFKGGQAAKTGTGGHLPGEKVTEKIAGVRGLEPGQAAVSPPRFPEWETTDDFRRFADEVREKTGGIPIGFKLSAQHIEDDIDAAIEVGVDYIILDGRGGGTGAAPLLFRDNISVPTLPALARARERLDETGNEHVTLIITGGLRTPADFAKALALGADGVAVSNAAIQAIGCLGTRACHTNNCPVGIATQKEHLRERLDVAVASERLARFFDASVHLMSTLARACGHTHLNQLSSDDLTTWKRDTAYLTGVKYGGVVPL